MAHAIRRRASGRWAGLAWPAIALAVTVAVGIPIESAAHPGDPAAALGDLAVAAAFVGCGVAVWEQPRGRDLTGPLMVATGVAWLAGTLADELALLHRAPLVQLLVTAPGGRPRTWAEWAVVAGAYALAAMPDLASGDDATAVLALALAGLALARCLSATGRQRRVRAVPACAAGAIALVLGAGAIADPADSGTVLWAYEAVLAATAVALLADRRWAASTEAAVTSLVIDLGDARSGSLAGVLGQAVGDPSLVVGYSQGDGRYADERGRPVTLPARESGRAVTTVEADGAPAAVLVHDPAALRSPRLSDAVTAAVHLALDNARLRADVRAGVREVEASRTRLLQARDTERRRLERRLRAGVGRRLDTAAASLRELADEPDELTAALPGELERTRAELRRFAAGLHPPDLETGGLEAALPALAAGMPVPVEVSVECGRLPEPLEVAAWFVCSEGLANVAKHSGAARATVGVERAPPWLVVTVEDDGRGGAEPAAGRGLRGLAARVEAAGGRLDVGTPPAGGTRLRARLPLEGPA
jgi:signal transduction histidine kinase